ncbi:MAG: amidohydrolase [Deltaproteobacteria bacterium]|nr:amidohydrolase [Deltaproteobacteria bacterium]
MAFADLILDAEAVVTMDPQRPRAASVAVRDGRIAAVGDRDTVHEQRGPGTEVVDLGSACLLPGLIEPHTHPDLCAQCYAWVDVSGFNHPRVEQVETVLRDAVNAASPDEWIYAFGLDPMLTADLGTWGRARLDAISPDNPLVVMIQSMHTLYFNSAALRAVKLDEFAPDPPGGGRYGRDADGRLVGKADEAPALLPFMLFMDTSEAAATERIWQQYRRYARAGLTTIGMPGLFTPLSMLGVFEKLSERGDVPVRNVAYLRHHQVGEAGRKPGQGSDTFRVQGVKLWYDGSPYSGTMLLDEPYLESRLCCCTLGIPAGTTGHANFEPAQLRELIGELNADGWQVLTHAQGDRGTREALDLYEHALSAHPRTDHRWRLEHCALISPADLERAARLGVTPSFHVNHVYWYGPELRDAILGAERAERLMPVATALAAGHRVSLHADSPMYPPEPLRLMRTAVTRRARNDEVIAGSEAISTEQALRAVTIDAAWQLFAEDRVGSIETGKLADFTAVDRDPLAIDPCDLDRLEVLGTWLGGRRIAR